MLNPTIVNTTCFLTVINELTVEISSVLHEQKNRTLDKLKDTSTFMNYDTFTELLVYVLQTLNIRETDMVNKRTVMN